MFRTVLTSLLAVLVLCGSAFAAEKTLIAAANPTWPPMEFLDENKNIIGYDRDIIAAIAEEIGMKSEFRNIAWDGIFASLESGQANVIASCVTITDKRKKAYVFSPIPTTKSIRPSSSPRTPPSRSPKTSRARRSACRSAPPPSKRCAR